MKIALGADHRGFEIKNRFLEKLAAGGIHAVRDLGTNGREPCDYPEIAEKVALAVARGEADRGILFCKSGIGMSIAANKVKGVRAALCRDRHSAELSRRHNDANVLVLSAEEPTDPLWDIVARWLEADFEEGRHRRRVDQIRDIENRHCR